jgi:hypothetical protein
MTRILLGLAAGLLLTSPALEPAARRNCALRPRYLSCPATFPLVLARAPGGPDGSAVGSWFNTVVEAGVPGLISRSA